MTIPSYHIWVFAAVGLLRLWELGFSARHLARDRRAQRAALIREPGFVGMVAVHGGWYAGMVAEVLWRDFPFPSRVMLPALVVWCLALALRAWVLLSLGEVWHVRLVARRDQPVITAGPYRYLRHPNYTAVILELAAVPLLVGAPLTALLGSLANGVVLYFRIRREEAYLFSVPGYERAFAHKKRLLPWVF